MPTYEYECKKCGHQFEAYQSITAEALKRCPKEECPEGTGRGTVKRLIGGGGGLLFKGSGFYITDYRSEGYKQAAKADGKSSSDTSAKSDSKSESKSESKSSSESSSKSSSKSSSSSDS